MESNGGTSTRITLAVLGQKLDGLSAQINNMDDRICAQLHDHELRIREIESRVVPGIQERLSRTETRQKNASVAQSIFTTVASAIAAWLGSLK